MRVLLLRDAQLHGSAFVGDGSSLARGRVYLVLTMQIDFRHWTKHVPAELLYVLRRVLVAIGAHVQRRRRFMPVDGEQNVHAHFRRDVASVNASLRLTDDRLAR